MHACAHRPETSEYMEAMKVIQPIVDDHRKRMVKGEPQLNYCDPAVMVNDVQMCVFMCTVFPRTDVTVVYRLIAACSVNRGKLLSLL